MNLQIQNEFANTKMNLQIGTMNLQIQNEFANTKMNLQIAFTRATPAGKSMGGDV
jgi:hypothetical protein